MAYRFKARSSTPGAHRLVANTMSALTPASIVVSGEDRGDGITGSYPTTATSKAEQLAADQAEVATSSEYITYGVSILGQAGSYQTTAESKAEQYAADQLEVGASSASIVTGVSILGQAGSYPTTATSKAEQLAADQAVVSESNMYILTGHTILGVDGTLEASEPCDTEALIAEGRTLQLADDQSEVSSSVQWIVSGKIILGQVGTYEDGAVSAKSIHIVRLSMMPVDASSTILNINTASIADMLHASREERVAYDPNVPNSIYNPTPKEYLELEAIHGYVLRHIDQTQIVTYLL